MKTCEKLVDAISLVCYGRKACAEVKIAVVEVHGLVDRELRSKMTLIEGMNLCDLIWVIEYTERPK